MGGAVIRKPTVRKARPAPRARAAGVEAAGARPARVIVLPPERVLAAHRKKLLVRRTDRCTKCSSAFVVQEPAFVHCCYCGHMMRIIGASMSEQEVFELRSGLRLAC